MDTQSEIKLQLAQLSTLSVVGMSQPSIDPAPERTTDMELAAAASANAVPGEPAENEQDSGRQEPVFSAADDTVPGEPAMSPPNLEEAEPGSPAPPTRLRTPGSGVPATMHPTALPTSFVPHMGQEIALLGPEAGEALRQRRVAERRWLFAQRGTRGPSDSPFQNHSFDPSVDYRGVEWGQPVPQVEWERRVYVELNPLATERRHEGKGAPPMCHACRRVGSRTVPLAKCVCCNNWACSRHLLAPACLDRIYPMCSSHPGLEVRPHIDFSYMSHYW
eukprot:1464789-Amphidinium_carterae.6